MSTTFKVFLVVFILAVIARVFIIDSFIVRGDSMAPTILDGDYIFINKYAYRFQNPKRDDIVVVAPQALNRTNIVKRIIGMPGEIIEIAKNHIQIKQSREDNGTTINEPFVASLGTQEIGISKIYMDPQEYFVMGDNRYASIDSREIGSINSWDIKGRAFLMFRYKNFLLKYF